MGIFDRLGELFALRRAKDPRYVETNRVSWSGRTIAGTVIDADSALEIPAVWACVRYLSQTVAVLPWRVMLEQDGSANPQPTNPIDYLLRTRPNPEISSFQFRETLLHRALRYGNGYAEIERDLAGRPLALWPIPSDRVEVMRDVDGALYYEINNGTEGRAQILPEDMFHLRGFGEGPVGVSAVQYLAQSLGWARSASLFGAAFFGNGLHTSTVIQAKTGLKVDAIRRMKAELQGITRGPRRWHEPVVLDNGAELKQISITPEQAQFIATNQHLIEEVCRIFGVPPHKIAHLLRATFSNIEHQAIEVVQDSIMPWAKRFEDEADYKLFGGNRRGYYTKINLRGLLRGDFKSQMEGLEIMRRNGAISADEWRALVEMNGMPAGSGGDKFIVNAASIELSKVGVVPEPVAAPAPDDSETNDDATDETADDAAEARTAAARAILALDYVKEAAHA